MRELGIYISHQRSKSVDEFSGQEFDYVSLCDLADAATHIRDAGADASMLVGIFGWSDIPMPICTHIRGEPSNLSQSSGASRENAVTQISRDRSVTNSKTARAGLSVSH